MFDMITKKCSLCGRIFYTNDEKLIVCGDKKCVIRKKQIISEKRRIKNVIRKRWLRLKQKYGEENIYSWEEFYSDALKEKELERSD